MRVKVNGVDVFHPSTGEVRSDGPDGIACWFIDTDYNEESFFVRHAYFLGANDPYGALKTTLKAEIDEEAWATLHSDTSRALRQAQVGPHRREGDQPPGRRGDEGLPGRRESVYTQNGVYHTQHGNEAAEEAPGSPPKPGVADALAKRSSAYYGVLFGNPGRSFYANEVIGLVPGTGAVQREAGARSRPPGWSRLSASASRALPGGPASPVFQEPRTLVLKTSGCTRFRDGAAQRESYPRCVRHGSIAKGEDPATERCHLMVVSDSLTYADCSERSKERSSSSSVARSQPTILFLQGSWPSAREARQCLRHARKLKQPGAVVADWERVTSPRNLAGRPILAEGSARREGVRQSQAVRAETSRRCGKQDKFAGESFRPRLQRRPCALCLAALRHSGYRAANRYIVFKSFLTRSG